MKVLITGANGLLGNNLTRELINRKYQVSVLLKQNGEATPGLDGLPVRRFSGDVLNTEAVSSAVRGHDVVIHAAANTQIFPPRCETIRAVNVKGTQHVVDACIQHQVKRLVHIGTANSFGPGSIVQPGNENTPYVGYRYGLDYMDSKFEAQQVVLRAVREQGLPAIIVNPTFMIGPYDTKPSSGALLLALYHHTIPFYTTGSKNYISVCDATVAIANAIEGGQVGECYILGNHNLFYRDAFSLFSKTMGVKAPDHLAPNSLTRIYGVFSSFVGKFRGVEPGVTKELARISCEDHCYSGEKAQKELALPRTDLQVAVDQSFRWFKRSKVL